MENIDDSPTPPTTSGHSKTRLWVLVGIAAAIVGCCFICSSIGNLLFKQGDKIEPRRIEAEALVRSHWQVIERIGDPVTVEDHKTNVESDPAELTFIASGPNGKADVRVLLDISGEEGRVTELTVSFDDGTRIDLFSSLGRDDF